MEICTRNFIRFLITAAVIALPCQGNAMGNMEIAEKLGHPKDAKLLIIHADDGGLSLTTNTAIVDAFKHGGINSASYMATCPWIYDAARRLADCPQCDVGVHMVLNSEWGQYRWGPVSSQDKVKSLVDETGALWASRELFIENAKLSHAKREVREQINKMRLLGFKPSHLDTHMGTIYTIPGLLEAYIEIAQENKLLPMVPKWSMELSGYLQKRPVYPAAQIQKTLLRLEEDQSVVMLDVLITDVGGKSYEDRKARYLKMLKELKPGLNQVIVHLADPSPEFDSIIESRPEEARRYWDRSILKDPEFWATLKAYGIVLTHWGQLNELIYPH
jgi:predicted glycoside hydrolase/deacetylase ChbG (UPF0249 family)